MPIIYIDSVTLLRENLSEDFKEVTEAHEYLRDSLTNTARKEDKNLPGEFFFKVIYLMANPDDPEEFIQVENDEPWDRLRATGRLACDM